MKMLVMMSLYRLSNTSIDVTLMRILKNEIFKYFKFFQQLIAYPST